MTLRIVILAASVVLAMAAPAAANGPTDRVVLAIDGRDIYVDLGARDGVGAGTELELLHEVVARDPRTGRVLRDHFALGILTVTKSGEKISVAAADPELVKRVLAGDRVRIVSPLRRFVDPWATQVEASKRPGGPASTGPTATPPPSGATVDHHELARVAWQETLGQPLEARVKRWLAFIAADPRSPYVPAVQKEIASLRDQIAARDAAVVAARSADPEARATRIARLAVQLTPRMFASARTTPDLDGVLAIAPVESAVPDQPLHLAFALRAPASVQRGWLFARTAGEPGYKRLELVPDGDAYLRATIPAALVRAPGVQWYVEIAGASGDPEPALGSQAAPRTIGVQRVVTEAPIASGRSHVDAHVDYVDFDGKLGDGFDQYYQAEIDFSYRFIEPIHAVRLGFGTLSGKGGPKDVIDGDPTGQCLDPAGVYRCKELTFSYVYTEFEHRLRPNVALMLRPQAGLLTTDESLDETNDCQGTELEDCQFTTRFGMRARLRLGDELGTNLVIGASFTAGIGTLLEAAYTWRPSRHVPVQLAVHATDQPVPEDFGVRLIADVGWRKLSWFYPSARLSYQARDIDHAGVSGGAALNFDW